MNDYMEKAIALGEQGRITAPPNPWVGCVIVNQNAIVGEGYHVVSGKPHAEVNALQQAGEKAKGATAYVTLEPCFHHGRTPPCSDALIRAGISHVVAALEDPDPQVAGKGFQALKQAGIKVTTGIKKEEVAKSLAPYLHHRKTGLPYCLLKAACSLDGRTAAQDGTSQWITSEAARADAHRLRAESQAILIGSGTAIFDKPRLTVRAFPVAKQPMRVILDRRGRVPPQPEGTLVTAGTIEETLQLLGKKGIVQVLVEGGTTLLGSFIESRIYDRLELYVAPKILGDKGYPLFKGLSITNIQDAIDLKLIGSQVLEPDIRLTFQ